MEDKKILNFFRKARRKIVRNLLLENLIIFAIIGLLLGTGIHVAALIFPIYGSMYWAILAVGLVVFIGIFYTIIRRPNNQKIALIVDSKGLDEQLITSMELKGKDDIISSLQKQKTIDAISRYSIKEKLPYKWSFTNVLLLVFALLAFLLAAVMPSDTKSQAMALHELEKVVEQEKDKVEEVKKEVTELEEISDAQLAELKKILEESMKEISEAEKEKDLEKAKERMETKLEKELEKQDNELSQKVSEILEKNDIVKKTAEEKKLEEQERILKEQLESLQKQLAQSDDKEQGKQSLDNKSGSENKNENGENGENESQSDKNSSKELMELSEQVQQAASNGLLSEEEMQQLAQSIAQANGNLSNEQLQTLTAQMSQILSSSQSASASEQATLSMGNSSESSNSNNENHSQGNGSGNGNGKGQGESSGAGNGGSASGAANGYDTGSKNGVEKEYVKNTSEEVTVPGNVGDDENLTGKSNGKGQSYTQKSQNGPTWAGNSVNYSQVVGSYANQAYSDVENNKVSDSMKEIVKSYFAGLTN